MDAPHPFQATYSTSFPFSQGKRFFSKPVHADGSQPPPPTSVQRYTPRGLPSMLFPQRGWWAWRSLYCTFNLFWRLVQRLPFSSLHHHSKMTENNLVWTWTTLSAALDAAHFVPLTCTVQDLSRNPISVIVPWWDSLSFLNTFIKHRGLWRLRHRTHKYLRLTCAPCH